MKHTKTRDKMAAVLVTVLTFCLSLQQPFVVADDCRYQVPSTREAHLCETYDLSKLAALGPFIVNGSGQDSRGEAERATYYLSLCGDVPEGFLPKACVDVGRAPAYQYTEGKACVALGNLSDVVAVSKQDRSIINCMTALIPWVRVRN